MAEQPVPQRRVAGSKYLPILLVFPALAVYANSFAVPFLFDDIDAILLNPHILRLWPIWEAAAGPAQTTIAARPVAAVTLALNYAVGSFGVWGYHAVNLAIHVLAALVAYGLLRRTFNTPRLATRYRAAAPWLAWSIALLWVVHPLHTNVVTYIIHRTESLMGLCYLLTVYSVLRGAQAPARAGMWYAAAVAACALGMGTKEVMVTAPLVALSYDRIFLAASWREILRRRGWLYAGLAATWGILIALVSGGSRSESAGLFFPELTPAAYALTQCRVILHYLRLAAWPDPLVFHYAWPVARHWTAEAVPLLATAGLVSATLVALRRWPAAGFLGLWFYCILAPTSSVLPIRTELAAERRMYLPLLAVIAAAVVGGYRLLEVWRRPASSARMRGTVAAAAVSALVVVFGSLTIWRNWQYRSPVVIWSDTVAKQPRSQLAHNDLGAALTFVGCYREAMWQYEQAIRLEPRYADPYYNMGKALVVLGHPAEALGVFTQLLVVDPNFQRAKPTNPCLALLQQGHQDQARQCLEGAARRSDPSLINSPCWY